MPRLKRIDPSTPGIRRRRAGRGFVYIDSGGRRVADQELLSRIQSLALPPAWKDVWICSHPMGHIQAIGVDAKGRKQYRYHDVWRMRRDQEKFDHMLEFARSLPQMRAAAAEHMKDHTLSRRTVLACAVRLLDLGFFRIGSEDYAEENSTYGVATILKEHTSISGNVVSFDYPAKGGKQRLQSVADPDVVRILSLLKRRRGGGQELLAFKQGGRWVDVRSNDVNDAIKEFAQGDFSAKDFRTWSATVLAAVALGASWRAESPTAKKRAVSRAIAEAAHYLGNTPAVCRSSYVDPRVIDRYLAGVTIREALNKIGEQHVPGTLPIQAVEDAVIEMLNETPTARRRAV